MLCEICGKETGSASRVVLDGAELVACPDCAGFGDGGLAAASAIAVQGKPKRNAVPAASAWQQRNWGAAPALQQRNQKSAADSAWAPEKARAAPAYSEPDIAENYGEIIRHAREKRGLTLKELGEKVFEKESVLHKVEKSKFEPDERLRKRIESFLGISLRSAEE
ncbi:MAG: multiprotein-bridging factor 1 family protein [Candidatus Diapherotrites archaeon]